ncbi:MAG: ABC transporter ATP-binding protein [Eubacteriales bacterium]|nr:ABC transporter ATP-binding protein [Eubacteriales bacterium]
MLETLKKFFAFCGEDNRKLFVTSIWLGVLSAICSAMRIPAAYLMICALLEDHVTMGTLWSSFGIIVVSVIITICINMKSTMLQTKGGYRACAGKRMEIAEHLRYLPMGWFNANSLGEVTSVTTNTMENMANIATRVVMITTKGFLTTGVIAIMMLLSDWRVGLVTLAGLLVFLLVNAAMQRKEQTVSQRKFHADERLVTKVLEYVQGIAEVKNFDLSKDTTTQVGDAVDECRKAAFGMEVPSVVFIFLQFLANKFTGVAVCISALVFYFDGTMPLAKCMTMLLCSFILFEQLDSAGSFSTLFRTIDIGVNQANAILDVPPMDIDGLEITPERCDIALEHVDFSYDQKKILDDVSLTIPEKSTVAIVGPSGSGKTTLCHLMARFWDVQGGRVTLGGRDVKDYSYDSLMRNFSFVFQRTYLFSDTIANNIRFGKPDASMDEVIAAAKKARCHDFIMALPEGYDTLIGEGGASLSGGERQRITIARAIMKDAPIIVLDEATANVDPENEKDLVEAIQELTCDKTVIMIAHRLKTVRHADQIVVLDGGKIVQQGTHAELVERDGIYRRFVVERRQAAGWKV